MSQYGNKCLEPSEFLSVINAINYFVNNVLSRCTCLLTLLKSHIFVNNAIKHLVRQVSWSITSYTTILGRRGVMCDHSATRAKILRVHLLTHSGERPHKCDHCYIKSFHQPSHLRTHMRTHIGEKSYKCK